MRKIGLPLARSPRAPRLGSAHSARSHALGCLAGRTPHARHPLASPHSPPLPLARDVSCDSGRARVVCARLYSSRITEGAGSRAPPQIHAGHARSLRTAETLEEELKRLASYAQTSVSLKATLDTGLGLLLPEQGNEELDKREH
ncbi:MAG: hypothetical protein SGPRY_007784 [Prymnesium sp.]